MSAVALTTNQGEPLRDESQTRQAIFRVHSRSAGEKFFDRLGGYSLADAAISGAGFAPAYALSCRTMNLNQHGAACRCLLRLRENTGQPGMSDSSFIERFLPRYPAWQERPGTTDATTLIEISKELQLASRMETFRDYDRVLRAHQAGRGILIQTEHAPEQIETDSVTRSYITLLVAMSEEGFTIWCPYPSGHSDTLPRTSRVWWERWKASGLVLYPFAADVTS
jgi:hypothetical protein